MAAIGGGHARIMDEFQLIEKLRLVENLFAGAATEGEREAAASAMDRGAKGVSPCILAESEGTQK